MKSIVEKKNGSLANKLFIVQFFLNTLYMALQLKFLFIKQKI